MELTKDIGRAALEEMVIATLIQDQDAAGEILSELSERDFRYPEWQGLMLAAKRLHDEGLPIIEGTLLAFYGDEGKLFSAYADRAARTKTPEDFHWLISELKSRSMLDSIKAAAERLASAETMDEAATIVSRINELSSVRRGIKITRLGDAVQHYVDRLGKEKPEFIRTGMRIFDDVVLLRKGMYWVIGGHASTGKTLLTLQIAQAMGSKYKVGYFSCETDEDKLAERTISYRAQIPSGKVARQNLTQAEIAQIIKVAKATQRLNVELVEASGMTAEDIRAITLARKFDIIFIDYLQNVKGQNPKATPYERASDTTRTLQSLSRTSKVLVIALSQLSRPETRKDGKLVQPTMASLRESGQIEQDADVISILYRQSMDNNQSNRIMKVVKNRDGELLDLLMAFSGATQKLEVIDRLHGGQSELVPLPENRGAQPPEDWKSAPRAF